MYLALVFSKKTQKKVEVESLDLRRSLNYKKEDLCLGYLKCFGEDRIKLLISERKQKPESKIEKKTHK